MNNRPRWNRYKGSGNVIICQNRNYIVDVNVNVTVNVTVNVNVNANDNINGNGSSIYKILKG